MRGRGNSSKMREFQCENPFHVQIWEHSTSKWHKVEQEIKLLISTKNRTLSFLTRDIRTGYQKTSVRLRSRRTFHHFLQKCLRCTPKNINSKLVPYIGDMIEILTSSSLILSSIIWRWSLEWFLFPQPRMRR